MRINIIRYSIIILLLAFVFSISSCGSGNRAYDTLFLRLKQDITTLDPAFIVDVDGGMVAAYLYNGLVRLDKDLNIIPDLAEKWEISEDGKTYKFYLRNNVKFSNGEVFTAKHVKQSFENLLNPNSSSPRSWVFEKVSGKESFMSGKAADVSGFRVINDYLFEIMLDEPFSPFLSVLTTPNAMVVSQSQQIGKEKVFLGTGPFKIESWQRGSQIVLIRNDDYFERKPHLNKIVIKIIPEDFTAITEFENGNIDIMEIPRAEFEYFTQYNKWKNNVYSTETLNTYYLGFNCQKEPFSNIGFRKGLSAGINIDMIIKNYMNSRVIKAQSPVPSMLLKGMINFTPEHDYDISFATEMIKKSGVKIESLSLNLYFNSDKEMEGIAELIQHDLGALGIKVQLVELEWTTFKEKITNGEAEMFILSWWADYPDIENFLYPSFHSRNLGAAGNRVRYKDDEFDSLIDRARMELIPEIQNSFYSKAMDKLINDSPWCCLWHKKKYTVCQPWVKNYYLPPIYNVDKGLDIQLDKNK